jgi:NADH-quinone oxidoreductase subunit C
MFRNKLGNISPVVSTLLHRKYFLYFNFLTFLKYNLQKWLISLFINNLLINLQPKKKNIINLIFFFQHHTTLLFKQLLDITAIDFVKSTKRFTVLYQFCSLHFNSRLAVLVDCSENELIPTLTYLYNSANWFECEVWDLFGIYFYGHPNMHRILTDYGFRYFPLRKDFPLSGYSELFYNNSKRRVGYYRVSISQEFRNFHYFNPWL